MNDDDQFEAWAKDQLDRRAIDVGADESARLEAARREAVAAVAEGQVPGRWRWAPLALTATVVMGVGLWRSADGPAELPIADPDFAVAQDMEMLEDLEFVAWMLESGALEDLESSDGHEPPTERG